MSLTRSRFIPFRLSLVDMILDTGAGSATPDRPRNDAKAKRREAHRTRRSGSQRFRARTWLATLLITLLVSTIGVVVAPQPAAAADCRYVGTSPFVTTQAGFEQRISLRWCYSAGGNYPEPFMTVLPLPGYNASHITGCAMHIAIVKEGTGNIGEIVTPCTAEARTGHAWALSAAGGWRLASANQDYHVTGWVNIQAARYYNTFNRAARVAFYTHE